jgi:hypothetical protein
MERWNFGIMVSLQFFKFLCKIPPDLPFPKGGESFPPFDKGGWRGIRSILSKCASFTGPECQMNAK